MCVIFLCTKREISAKFRKISKTIFRVAQSGFLHGFGAFEVNPSPAPRQPSLSQGCHESVRFSALYRREKQRQNPGFTVFNTKVCTFKTSDFRRSFFAPQPVTAADCCPQNSQFSSHGARRQVWQRLFAPPFCFPRAECPALRAAALPIACGARGWAPAPPA